MTRKVNLSIITVDVNGAVDSCKVFQILVAMNEDTIKPPWLHMKCFPYDSIVGYSLKKRSLVSLNLQEKNILFSYKRKVIGISMVTVCSFQTNST